jgi:RNA polymerase sigma-70 factor, ECF subfamily
MPDDKNPRNSEFLRYYAECEGSLRTFIRSMLQSREDVSEVLQETTLLLWDKFSEFDQSRDFKNWAFGVARMKALALLRDRRRDRHIFDDDLVTRLADESIALESRHLCHREAISNCLEKLPAHQREMVLAAYTKGTRMDELAKQRMQTPMALYKLLQRIRLLLLQCVRQQFKGVEA